MKTKKRILSILLTLCMLVGAVGVLPVSAIEYSSDYAISNVTYVPTGTLGSTQDMLQWSNVGAISYRLEIHDENNTLIDYVIQTENYAPAAQILPYSGKFYVVVVPLDENNVSVWSGTASDMFTYTDKTPPTATWRTNNIVRSSDSEATVQFDNLDRYSACTYYYAIVESGAAAPTIDTTGAGNTALNGSNDFNLTDLTAGAKDIYLILKDQDGNASAPIMTTIPAFVPETTYSVKIFTTVADYGTTTDIGGSISGAGDYKEGDTVTLTASPNSGYCAIGWGSNNNVTLPTGSSSEYLTITFTMPAEDVEITGSFRAHTLGVFYKDLENGTHDSYCFYCGVIEGNPTAHSDLTDYTGEGDPDGWCDACGAEMHTHSYSSEWSKDASGHWYECECGEKSAFAEHTSSGAATEDKAEVCTVCGYEISPKLTHTHSYGTLKYDSNNHWHECDCGDNSDVTAHSGGTATCTEKAICSVCNQPYGNLKNHTYSTEWSKDASGHWYECECGEKSAFAGHTSSGAATEDKAEVCTVCGYEISPKLTHTHSYDTLKYNANKHWYECSCGAKSGETAHSYMFECSAKCSGCDYERLTTHVYDGEDCGDGEQHLLRCRYCGVQYRTDNLTSVFPHEYDDDCDSVCDICGYERTDAHNYEWIKDAEGHEEKCSVCGDVMVAKTAHTSDSPATNDTPETCTVCGYEIAPKLESTLTIVYNNTTIGGELAYHPGRAKYTFPTGTVVDLSDYWPEKREYRVDGCQYYFSNFVPSETGGVGLTSIVLKGDTTIYANWVIDTSKWVITFDATGGSIVPKKIIDYTFSGMDFYQPTRPGYEFLGWSLENDGTPDDLRRSRLTSDCTLYATWKRIHNISPNWSYDEEVHYRTCDCGERHDETEHSYYIGSSVCYKCGYVKGMAIGSTDKTSVEFVPVTGTTLPEGSYLDVKAYEVVEQDVETIFKATVTDGVSDVTEITPPKISINMDDGWMFSDQYTLRLGDRVTIAGITYIVVVYNDDRAALIYNGGDYILDKERGLYKDGEYEGSYSTDTEIVSIDGVQYVVTLRITSANAETVYIATMDGKSAGYYYYWDGVIKDAIFYADCTPEALTPKVSVGGVVTVKSGQFLVNTASGVKVANTIWANNIGLYGADGLPVTGVSGTLTVSGIQYAATKSTIAAHIGAQGVDVGRFDDSVFDIRDVDDFSPFVLLDVTDFSGTVIELTGVTEHTHTFEWKIDKEATESEDGIKHEECACGEKRNENTVISKTGTDQPTAPNTSDKTVLWIVLSVVALGIMAVMATVIIKKRRTI